jgi:hypothetical protein
LVFEVVYAQYRYWDGPREGVADYQGRPHYYAAEWDAACDDYADTFLLTPVDADVFATVRED